jgi:hypothetical protein
VEGIGSALDAVSARNAERFFEYCAYRTLTQRQCKVLQGRVGSGLPKPHDVGLTSLFIHLNTCL